MYKFTHAFVTPPIMKQITGVDGKRQYLTPEGHNYESVTTFINRNWGKPGLEKWKKKVGPIKAKKEQIRTVNRGKSLHTYIEDYLMNKELVFDNPVKKSNFIKTKPLLHRMDNIRLIEKSLYSDELQLAGTPDTISDFDDELSVIDFKSANKIKKRIWIVDFFLQTACYAVMFNERFGVMPKKAVIIMSAEDTHKSIVYIEPMGGCLLALKEFMKDPVIFQKNINEFKENMW